MIDQSSCLEVKMRKEGKPERSITVTKQNLLCNGNQCEITTFRDTTIQVELRTAQEQNKTTSLLVSTVTHELITPLRCIVSMTDQLFQAHIYDNFFDEKINTKIKMIRSTAKLLLSQINMTLDMSLLTQAHFTPIIKEANLRVMCKTTLALLKGQAQAMGILLMLNFNLNSDVYFFDEMRVN